LSHCKPSGSAEFSTISVPPTYLFAFERVVVLDVFAANYTVIRGGDIQRPSLQIGTLAVGLNKPVCCIGRCGNAEEQ
jgi:hypothetical protein